MNKLFSKTKIGFFALLAVTLFPAASTVTAQTQSEQAIIIRATDYDDNFRAALSGDDEAMRLTGLALLYGTGCEKNFEKGMTWLGKSCHAGNHEAQYDLGMLFLAGDVVPQNFEDGAYWLRKSASNGNVKAMVNLARLFHEGTGVLKDDRVALENYWRAADRGNPEGQYMLACMLRDGVAVKANPGKARYWFEKAAAQGYKDAAAQAAQIKAAPDGKSLNSCGAQAKPANKK